jgi:HSP20 family protein
MEKNKLTRKSVNQLSNRLNFFPSRISDILDEMMSDFPNTSDRISDQSVNVKETDTIHQIQISTPGYKKENFKIDIDENVLTISNEYKEETKNENEKFTLKEFRRSSFSRSFYLAENLKTDEISAKYEDGILYIDIPKQDKIVSKTRTIEIK